jgi:hypothetical protein
MPYSNDTNHKPQNCTVQTLTSSPCQKTSGAMDKQAVNTYNLAIGYLGICVPVSL